MRPREEGTGGVRRRAPGGQGGPDGRGRQPPQTLVAAGRAWGGEGGPGGGLHPVCHHQPETPECRGERITTIRMTAEIFPKCATRRKWVLGYVQEGKVLKVVLSIKFIWGRDILYPRPSKID